MRLAGHALGGALALALAVSACRAEAAPQEHAATVRRAARLCASGEREAAARELRALEAELGPDHPAVEVVRLYLDRLDPGADAPAPETRATRREAEPPRVDPALDDALRDLRACAGSAPAPLPPASAELSLREARQLFQLGRYDLALAAARKAQAAAAANALPELRLRIHETLALIHAQRGDREGGLAAASAAEELARRTGDVQVRITLARLLLQWGELERARESLEALEAGPLEPLDRAELEEARGDLALRLGAARIAIAHLARARDGHVEAFGADHPSTAAVRHLQGDAYRVAGEFPAAIDAYRDALRVRRTALGPDHPETARTQNAIGVLEADLGDWRSADASFSAALANLERSEVFGPGHPESIKIRANRALARFYGARSQQAAGEYASAVEALGGALGQDHPDVAAAVRNLARIESDRGNRKRAEALLERGLAAQLARLGASHPDLAPTRLARGRLLAQRGDLAGAAREVDLAIAVLSEALGPDHPVTSRARTTRARIAVAQRDDATALREASEAARALAAHARRTFGAISERQREILGRDSQDVVGALLSVEKAPAPELFVSLLPHRDSVLRSIAAGRHSVRESGGQAGLHAQLETLRGRYVAAVHSQAPGAAERVKELAEAIDGLEALVLGAGPPGADRDPRAVLARVCERLAADSALIWFNAYDRTRPGSPGEKTPAYAALIVLGSGCRVQRIELGAGERIDAAAEAFAAAMREQRADEPAARAELGRAVIEPLAPILGGIATWLVVPDGSLWGVPLGALPDPGANGRYLLERVTIGYLTSAHELAEVPADGAGAGPSLLIGSPDFGSREGGRPVVLTNTGPCELPPFDPLPGTRLEIEDIAPRVAAPRVLLGDLVTRPRIERELADGPWLVHFATHAYFGGAEGCGAAARAAGWREDETPVAPNPLLLSGIALAGANSPAAGDSQLPGGILTAYEIAGLDLRSVALVVLSACDTGTGLHLRGQEIQGLRWGFRAAGARALVTSLWRSNDVATRRMMGDFYEALASEELADHPLRGAAALRRAQLGHVQTDVRLGIRRPLSWANFVFSGVLAGTEIRTRSDRPGGDRTTAR